jgi:hypothetical protein
MGAKYKKCGITTRKAKSVNEFVAALVDSGEAVAEVAAKAQRRFEGVSLKAVKSRYYKIKRFGGLEGFRAAAVQASVASKAKS